MVQVQSPIGELILISYKHPENLNNSSLEKELMDFIDLLKFRIKKNNIEDIEESLHSNLYSLRLEIIKHLLNNIKILREYETTIINEIGKKLYLKSDFHDLGLLLSKTLEIYFQVVRKITKSVDNYSAISQNKINELPTYESLKNLNVLQPSPELNIFIKWLESSISYDFYLIVSELVVNSEISLNKKQHSELRKKLKSTIVDFGAYSAVSGIWNPKHLDENQLIRNIKIKVAIIELDYNKCKSITTSQLSNLLIN